MSFEIFYIFNNLQLYSTKQTVDSNFGSWFQVFCQVKSRFLSKAIIKQTNYEWVEWHGWNLMLICINVGMCCDWCIDRSVTCAWCGHWCGTWSDLSGVNLLWDITIIPHTNTAKYHLNGINNQVSWLSISNKKSNATVTDKITMISIHCQDTCHVGHTCEVSDPVEFYFDMAPVSTEGFVADNLARIVCLYCPQLHTTSSEMIVLYCGWHWLELVFCDTLR